MRAGLQGRLSLATPEPCRQLRSTALAAWFGLQEAAKQCIGQRLATPLGNAAQTLAGLERAVQRVLRQQVDELQRLGETAALGSAADGGGEEQGGQSTGDGGGSGSSPSRQQQRQQALLLLLFMLALEQNLAAATGGSSSRGKPPRGAIAFFAANEKVGGGLPSRVHVSVAAHAHFCAC